MNNTSLELTVRAQNALQAYGRRMAARLQDQHGQTAAEYLGIIVIVAAIIVAITKTKLDETISTGIKDAVNSIAGK